MAGERPTGALLATSQWARGFQEVPGSLPDLAPALAIFSCFRPYGAARGGSWVAARCGRVFSTDAGVRPSKSYEFIGFGAIDVTKTYKFIVFGDIDGPKPYNL